MFRWRVVVAALAFAGLVVATGAFAQTDPCTPPAVTPKVPRVTIDLATGARTEGETEYRTGQAVEILFINANPFLYEYQVDNKVTVIEDKDLGSFLGAWLPVSAGKEVPTRKDRDWDLAFAFTYRFQ